MPDEALFHAAETGQLEDPGVLASQARRMLADPKSKALAENFAAQWLEFRNLDSIQRDPVQFPEFTPALRDSMRQETELFVENMLHTNRSILDFLNAQLHLREWLARESVRYSGRGRATNSAGWISAAPAVPAF